MIGLICREIKMNKVIINIQQAEEVEEKRKIGRKGTTTTKQKFIENIYLRNSYRVLIMKFRYWII